MKARVVFPISAGFALLALVFAWQISPALRGGERPAPRMAESADPVTEATAAKIAADAAADDQSNGSDDAKSIGPAFLAFTFEFDEARIQASDKNKLIQAAAYVAANPTSRIGLDGRGDPNGNGLRNQNLMDLRVAAVRDALIKAGIPSDKIQTGNFAESQSRRDREVAAVIIAAPKKP